MAKKEPDKLPPRYSTTEAARSEMPATVAALVNVRDHGKSEIAIVQAALAIVKLAKLDQIPDIVDTSVDCVPITSENGKVVPINAGATSSHAAAN